MKQLIFALLFMALLLGCHESNSVEPILDNSTQQNKWDNKSAEGILNLPQKDLNTKEVDIYYKYNFKPGECGKSNKPLKYIIDKENIDDDYMYRHLYDVEIETPSTTVINNKPFKTSHVYKLNRIEKITPGGKILNGTTWGTFKILYGDEDNEVEMFRGDFTGEILFSMVSIKLTGKGLLGSYKDRTLLALEKQVCNSSDGKLQCWTSDAKGKLAPKVRIDN
ncbi:MAG: hypothetical protein ABFS12_11195 [Bacteroidota bacterium]